MELIRIAVVGSVAALLLAAYAADHVDPPVHVSSGASQHTAVKAVGPYGDEEPAFNHMDFLF
ncbi:hypothetical protein [Streptomyces sp. NPDC057939]|uniref:hypothetical protein n=1 Tax=Streptomyces sp. NPDC057939 TaxID=3346284 RepID=UPI0036E3BC9A